MSRAFRLTLGLALVALPASADEFDQLDGAALESLAKAAPAREALSVPEIGTLPNLLRGSRSALLVATTDQGNPCRLLVTSGLRKAPGGKGEAVPVLILERFDTFEAGNLRTRLARGRDLLLFDGFRVDLDSGTIVPDGQGGDLQFRAGDREKKEPSRLAAAGGARLIAPAKLPAASTAPDRPSPGRVVLPGDFAGRYRLFANGQWSGTLDLKAEAKGALSGQFRSDQTGNSYKVEGQVETNPTNHVRFTVEYPRTKQEFDGLLFVENKGAIAGTVTLLDRPFGFFALREGGTFAPDGEDLGPSADNADRPGRLTLSLHGPHSYELDGKPLDDASLPEALKAASSPDASLLIRASGDLPFSAVRHAIASARAAGIDSIRLGLEEKKSKP